MQRLGRRWVCSCCVVRMLHTLRGDGRARRQLAAPHMHAAAAAGHGDRHRRRWPYLTRVHHRRPAVFACNHQDLHSVWSERQLDRARLLGKGSALRPSHAAMGDAAAPPWHATIAGGASAVVSRTFTCAWVEPLPPPPLDCPAAAACWDPAGHLRLAVPSNCTPADPPDTVKARLQVQGSGGASMVYRGTADAFAKIAAREVRCGCGGLRVPAVCPLGCAQAAVECALLVAA